MRRWLFLGSLNGLAAVAAGAYGWHWLDPHEGFLDIFNLGVEYQMWHALALLAVAWLASRAEERGGGGKALDIAGWSFTAGIVLFSGTLYIYGHVGAVLVPLAAPLGGVLLLAGWAALMWAAIGEKAR